MFIPILLYFCFIGKKYHKMTSRKNLQQIAYVQSFISPHTVKILLRPCPCLRDKFHFLLEDSVRKEKTYILPFTLDFKAFFALSKVPINPYKKKNDSFSFIFICLQN